MNTSIRTKAFQALRLLLSVVLAGALLTTLLFCSSSAYASNSADVVDPTANAEQANIKMMLGDDYLWAGLNMDYADATSENDILAAGKDLCFTNATIKGSLRVAGQSITVADSKIAHSATLAAQNIVINRSTAKGLALAAQTVDFDGAAESLYAAAQTVTLSGTIKGDVHVSASELQVLPDTVIEGTIYAEVEQEPMIDSSVSYGDLQVTLTPMTQEEAQDFQGFVGALMGTLAIGSFLISLVSIILIALLCEWLGRKRTADAAAMIKARTGAFVGTGIIGAIASPLVCIILCCLVVTLPIAGALACALGAITLVGTGFMAASLGKLVFRKMKPLAATVIAALILGALSAVPFIGWLVTIVGFMYLLGYILQRIFLNLKERKASKPAPEQA